MVDVVVSALAAGAAAGVKDTATAAVKDAYAGLLAALRRRFGHARTEQLTAMAQEHAEDPQAGHDRLTAVLATADLASDDDVVTAARAVLAQLDSAGTHAGKYTVDARDAKGVQIGDGNSMTLHL
jgi:hypothetical protein